LPKSCAHRPEGGGKRPDPHQFTPILRRHAENER